MKKSRTPSINLTNILYGFLGIVALIITSVIIYQLWNSKSTNEGFSEAAVFDYKKCSFSKIDVDSLIIQLNKYDTLIKNKILKPSKNMPNEKDISEEAKKLRKAYTDYLNYNTSVTNKINDVNLIIRKLNGSSCIAETNRYLNARYPNGKNIFQKAS